MCKSRVSLTVRSRHFSFSTFSSLSPGPRFPFNSVPFPRRYPTLSILYPIYHLQVINGLTPSLSRSTSQAEYSLFSSPRRTMSLPSWQKVSNSFNIEGQSLPPLSLSSPSHELKPLFVTIQTRRMRYRDLWTERSLLPVQGKWNGQGSPRCETIESTHRWNGSRTW